MFTACWLSSPGFISCDDPIVDTQVFYTSSLTTAPCHTAQQQCCSTNRYTVHPVTVHTTDWDGAMQPLNSLKGSTKPIHMLVVTSPSIPSPH
jgi:hypothetical protein